MLLRFCGVLILSSLLTTSSFSLRMYLSAQIIANDYTQSQLIYAVNSDILIAQKIYLKQLHKNNSHWLALAKKVGRTTPHIAWQLAEYYQQKENIRNNQFWADRALKLGSINALVEKAAQVAQDGAPKTAKHILSKVNFSNAYLRNIDNHNIFDHRPEIVERYANALRLSIKLAIRFSDNHWFSYLVAMLKQSPYSENIKLKQLYQQLLHFNVIKNHQLNEQSLKSLMINTLFTKQQCEYPLQIFASDIDHLSNIEFKLNQIKQQPFFAQSFCFMPVRFINSKFIQCDHQHNQRINCYIDFESQAFKLASKQVLKPDRFIGFITKEGNANVNDGVLFLDDNDTQQVVEHELLHLLGYIDEYPLPQAHDACLQNQTTAIAKNIIVDNTSLYESDNQARLALKNIIPWFTLIDSQTPITYKTPQGFKLGTPLAYKNKIGLFVARTCKHQTQIAFKPVYKPTKLEYFEEPLPKIYKSKQLRNFEQFNMPFTGF